MALAIGARLDRYTVLALLGEGASGEVYRARDAVLARTLALRVLRPDPGEGRADEEHSLLCDARAAAALVHPNVASVFDVGTAEGRAYVAMELVEGRTLRAAIAAGDAPLAHRVRWLLDVADALAAAHAQGIVHAALRPENVMLRADGVVKVLDFGLARGAHDARSDQLSWGLLAYETLTGRPPNDARGDVPQSIEAVLLRATAKDPAARFDDMRAAHAALERALSVPDAPVTRRSPRLEPPRPRRARGALALLAFAAALVTLVAWALSSRSRPESRAAAATVAPTATHAEDLPSRMSANADARTAYLRAAQAERDGDHIAAAAGFARATELDPDFAAAHLRAALAVSLVDVDAPAREHFRRATQLRADLGTHDRAMLAAFEPWTREPPDGAEAARRLTELARERPTDTDLAFVLCRVRIRTGDYAGAREACRSAVAIDPRFVAARCFEAHARLLEDDVAGAFRIYEDGEPPSATVCMFDHYVVAMNEGRCDEAVTTARRLVALDPSSWRRQRLLGTALHGSGASLDAVRAAFALAWERMPASERAAEQHRTEGALAVLSGDLAAAEKHFAAWARATDARPDESEHADPFLARAHLLLELGKSADAATLSEAMLKARVTWLPAPQMDSSILALGVLRRSGKLDAASYARRRDAWFEAERPRFARSGRLGPPLGYRWIWGWAAAARSPEDAADAVLALPRFLPLSPALIRDVEADEPIGRAFLLARRTDDALRHLERATRSCGALDHPIEAVWAWRDLGDARAVAGDVRGACEAYRAVLDRWGAAGSSTTAREARDRVRALRCDAAP